MSKLTSDNRSQTPKINIWRQRNLVEISNTRLFRLKHRTLLWYFRIEHIPMSSNHTADAMSRSYSNDISFEDMSESMIATAISRDIG